MRTLALAAAMMAATAPTAAIAADWVYLDSGGGRDFYIDRESIRTMPNGNKRAWLEIVRHNPDKFGDTSSKSLTEFDCREGRYRLLQSTYFKGERVTTTDAITSEWRYASPDSLAESLLNYVCV